MSKANPIAAEQLHMTPELHVRHLYDINIIKEYLFTGWIVLYR